MSQAYVTYGPGHGGLTYGGGLDTDRVTIRLSKSVLDDFERNEITLEVKSRPGCYLESAQFVMPEGFVRKLSGVADSLVELDGLETVFRGVFPDGESEKIEAMVVYADSGLQYGRNIAPYEIAIANVEDELIKLTVSTQETDTGLSSFGLDLPLNIGMAVFRALSIVADTLVSEVLIQA